MIILAAVEGSLRLKRRKLQKATTIGVNNKMKKGLTDWNSSGFKLVRVASRAQKVKVNPF